MSNDIYAPPESELNDAEKNTLPVDQLQLASRWKRLGATLVDVVLVFVCLFAIGFAYGMISVSMTGDIGTWYENEQLMAILMFAVYYVINFRSLMLHGQTLGKKLLNIKVVNPQGKVPGLFVLLFKRSMFFLIIQSLPFIGVVIFIFNPLMIFSGETRCGHDYFANTDVVDC